MLRAVIAGIAAGNVVRRLASGRKPVVAGAAATAHLRMVNRVYWRESVCVVAILADIGCRYVCRRFACRVGAIVAAAAIAGDINVAEVGRNPSGRCVAIVAGVRGIEVCRMFAGGCNAVVARATGADDLGVVDGEDRREDVGRMAVLADVGGLNVGGVLARRLGAVMAAGAVATNIDVIEVRWQPADGRMAVIAVIATGYVVYALAGCRNAIVTGSTGAEHLGVVNRRCRFEGRRAVAVLADAGRLHMRRALAGRRAAVMTADQFHNPAGRILPGPAHGWQSSH